MKKRIWNQLKKAVMITAAVGTLGAGAVSAAEFEAAELYVPAVGLKQSAQWIDEEKFQAELPRKMCFMTSTLWQNLERQPRSSEVPAVENLHWST